VVGVTHGPAGHRSLAPEEVGATRTPRWGAAAFDPVADSLHNAQLGVELLDAMVEKRGILGDDPFG
jgi:glyceraldehyde-3-phosphate dehydrogenase (ferredoxin)